MASVSSSDWKRFRICSIVRDWYSMGGGSIICGLSAAAVVVVDCAAGVVVVVDGVAVLAAGVLPNNPPPAGTAGVAGVFTGLGAFAAGVGTTDLQVGILKGICTFKTPETLKINVTGKKQEGVFAKDIILSIVDNNCCGFFIRGIIIIFLKLYRR